MMRRAHKYGAQATESRDGVKHPSKKQARRWDELRLLERGGAITGLRREVTVYLLGANGEPLRSETGRRLSWRADFVYAEDGAIIYEDAKGYATPEYRLKRSILAAQGIQVRET